MSSGLIIAAEIGVTLVVCLGWAALELRSLRRLRLKRDQDAAEARREPP